MSEDEEGFADWWEKQHVVGEQLKCEIVTSGEFGAIDMTEEHLTIMIDIVKEGKRISYHHRWSNRYLFGSLYPPRILVKRALLYILEKMRKRD